ncbi:hypothetical protein SUGI_0123620 [Cryptomeria japonica]|nr:hypothetical protein SUGI_0123620 [Cryptomeria japonica]
MIQATTVHENISQFTETSLHSLPSYQSKSGARGYTLKHEGVDSVAVDRTENKITIEGAADPVSVTNKLRRFGYTELLSLGPAKEEEKKPEENKPPEENPSPVIYLPAYGYNDYVTGENSTPCTIL